MGAVNTNQRACMTEKETGREREKHSLYWRVTKIVKGSKLCLQDMKIKLFNLSCKLPLFKMKLKQLWTKDGSKKLER